MHYTRVKKCYCLEIDKWAFPYAREETSQNNWQPDANSQPVKLMPSHEPTVNPQKHNPVK